jgi:hypothetical protein
MKPIHSVLILGAVGPAIYSLDIPDARSASKSDATTTHSDSDHDDTPSEGDGLLRSTVNARGSLVSIQQRLVVYEGPKTHQVVNDLELHRHNR